MGFIESQILIFSIIILAGIIGGKKAAIIASLVWAVETMIVLNIKKSSYLQVITVSLSFQLGLIIGVIRDYIMKKIRIKNKS